MDSSPSQENRQVVEALRARFERSTEKLTPDMEPAPVYSAHVRVSATPKGSAE